jgi:hypothetical protein
MVTYNVIKNLPQNFDIAGAYSLGQTAEGRNIPMIKVDSLSLSVPKFINSFR